MKRLKEYRSVLAWVTIWAVAFIIEVLVAWWEVMSDSSCPFGELWVRRFLLPTMPFVILFFAHDLFLAPLLVQGRKVLRYILSVTVLMGLFSLYVFYSDGFLKPEPRPDHGEMTHRPSSGQTPPPPPHGRFDGERFHDRDDHHLPDRDMMPIGASVSKIIIALMMLGVDLGAKYFSNYTLGKKRLEELEKENLRYRLEYLRYQINPHFFMNTLNNIHALVDVSPEKAKDSIVELSRLMRHVLYDSNGPTVALSKEIDFLRHYLYLMRLRYTDSVRIEYTFPEDDGGAQVPPLLMATIAENAFKHGVSYKSDSYIRLSVALEPGKMIFRCANSLRDGQDERTVGGIGLDNIQKRLSLLYGEDFVLHIDKSATEYEVLMVLPSKPVSVC